MEKNRTKILIVDDEVEILEILKLNFESEGYEVHLAENGLEALKKIQTTNFDLVISDYMMPKMNGVELLKKVRETNDLLAFIFFSGNANDEVARQVVSLGASGLVNKVDIFKLPGLARKALNLGKGLKKLSELHTEEAEDFINILNSKKP